MACTITAKKLCIDVVHVEAGIRSGDRTMPEEINRILTDAICDHFFTTSEVANEQLRQSGVQDNRIHFVGNTMIDTLYQNLHKLKQPQFWNELGMKAKEYFLITLHRPSNVDDAAKLKSILEVISASIGTYKIIFPVHPRTKKMLDQIDVKNNRLFTIDPLGYHQFIYLVQNAKAIITDSGGITEEATVLNVPCLTLRNLTERPETVSMRTNELIGEDCNKVRDCLTEIIFNRWKEGSVPPLWDGKASERILVVLISKYILKNV